MFGGRSEIASVVASANNAFFISDVDNLFGGIGARTVFFNTTSKKSGEGRYEEINRGRV